MGKASSKHKVDKPELVLELFKKAGHTHHIKPGHVLIEQGKESESLFLVVSGELVLKRGTKELARRGVGQLLGEMSFLLGEARRRRRRGAGDDRRAPASCWRAAAASWRRRCSARSGDAERARRSGRRRCAPRWRGTDAAHVRAHVAARGVAARLAKKFELAASTALIILRRSVFFAAELAARPGRAPRHPLSFKATSASTSAPSASPSAR